ncbi:DUF4244 domain-containing protein [Streptomyces phytohabitans]|uniref:DUF4244 domain-containing protein n=1 Tax=Streptomyces phytohabitans TaxID=1150371 RepID=UPI00345BD215
MLARVRRAARSRWQRARGARTGGDRGMATAEYAMGTIAAAALGAVLCDVATSGVIRGALQRMIERALDAPV